MNWVACIAATVLLCAAPARAQDTVAAPSQRPMNPTQEVAGEKAEGPAFEAGPMRFRLGGYLGVTGIYRSTNSGGGPGTNFASIPYSDDVRGNVSEARLTAQTSRLSIRMDADFPEDQPRLSKLGGYFEMDFNGTTSGTIAVSSTSAGFRLRHAFGEAQYAGRFYLAAGQAFSLMTPAKNQLSVWPADSQLTQAVDTNYLAGMVWSRLPQVRFTYRPTVGFNWAVSIENPEQQLGRDVVTLPACCGSDLDAQYNTGSDELKVPNLMPDLVSRVAFNRGGAIHVDAGGVVRVFRHSLAPYDRDFKQLGGGVSVASQFSATKVTNVILQAAWGSGMGRYIGGLAPDVVIRANGEISPVRTGSWVAGIEQRVEPKVSVAGYYSGIYAFDNFSIDEGGEYIGFGYPGSPRSNNRRIHEVTAVAAFQAWRFKDRGSMQLNTQLSWLTRTPWWGGTGPEAARALMVFAQLRYSLP